MKNAVTKEKSKKFAKEIFRSTDLVYELGLMNEEALNTWTFVEFPEEIQEAWFSAVNAEERRLFFKRIRKEVSECVAAELTKKKKISYHTIAKYSYVLGEKELDTLKQKGSGNANIVKLCIIRELSELLKDAKIMEGETELASIVNSAKKIYALVLAKSQKKGGKP